MILSIFILQLLSSIKNQILWGILIHQKALLQLKMKKQIKDNLFVMVIRLIYIFQINSIVMNKRSFSEKIVSKNKPQKTLITKETTLKHSNNHNCKQILQEKQILLQKIDQSKPILQTIYDKFHKKQQIYQEKIKQKDLKCTQLLQVAKQYKSVSLEGMRIISKNCIFPQQRSHNYKKTFGQDREKKQRHQDEAGQQNILHKYVSVGTLPQKNSNTYKSSSNIIAMYRRQKEKQEEIKREKLSVYERYLHKINENKENEGSFQNRDQNALVKIRKLSRQIDNDIHHLSLKKTESSIKLDTKKTLKVKRTEQKGKDRKSYFLQIQKRKLKQGI